MFFENLLNNSILLKLFFVLACNTRCQKVPKFNYIFVKNLSSKSRVWYKKIYTYPQFLEFIQKFKRELESKFQQNLAIQSCIFRQIFEKTMFLHMPTFKEIEKFYDNLAKNKALYLVCMMRFFQNSNSSNNIFNSLFEQNNIFTRIKLHP